MRTSSLISEVPSFGRFARNVHLRSAYKAEAMQNMWTRDCSVRGQREHIVHDGSGGMFIGDVMADAVRVSRDDSKHVAG